MRHARPLLAAGVVGLAVGLLNGGLVTGALTAPAASAEPGVCQGVPKCRVVAHVDVNGDRRRDVVGAARVGKIGAPQGAVVVRVKTAPGTIASITRKTQYWNDNLWQGAATLDRHRGKDLMVGHEIGAHTEFFAAFTWRKGGLVGLDAPGAGRYWIVDGAYRDSFGWLHRKADPAGLIRKRVAERVRDTKRFHGTIRTFRWKAGEWTKVSVVKRRLTEKQAGGWAGFHVPGLAIY
jgi:hypothetical protein